MNENVNNQSPVQLYSIQRLQHMLSSKNAQVPDEVVIEIPPVQRGLVWNPSQVGILWDSIWRGMPIGSLLAYTEKGSTSLQLLDGQQRCNAIKCGIAPDQKDSFRVWVTEDGDGLSFMVCSESHPWGYKNDNDYSPFSYEERDVYNALLRGESEVVDIESSFAIAKLHEAYPMVKMSEGRIYVPLAYALEGEVTGYNKWKNSESSVFRKPREIVSLSESYRRRKGSLHHAITEDDIQKKFNSISRKLRDKDIVNYSIPVHIINSAACANNKYIETLFSRVNTQGTPLSNEDAMYSSLCVLLGAEIKKLIENLSQGFMPPARLARWAVRLYKLLNPSKAENRNILTQASEADFHHVIKDENANGFIQFCRNTLGCIIAKVKTVYNSRGNSVPALVYLEHRDDHWITVIAAMEWESASFSEWLPLLGMLPDVVCSRMDSSHLFIHNFWNGYKSLKAETPRTLDYIIPICCAYAALQENSFVHKYPSSIDGIKAISNGDILDNEWNWNSLSQSQSRALIPFTNNNFILYYAQREYLNLILAGLKPEMRRMWGKENNRPYDIDHIIPRDFWPNEWMMNQLPNKQILYFRHNRKKGAHGSGLPDSPAYLKNQAQDWFIYPNGNSYSECKKHEDKSQHQIFKQETINRWVYLIEKVYQDLHIDALIEKINALVMKPLGQLPSPLPEAIERYNFMKKVEKELEKEIGKLQWGGVTYRGLARNNVIGMMKIDEVQDFYHSLEPWLSLGKEKELNGVPIFPCITMGVNKNIEIGKRRGFGISRYVDHEMYKRWMQIERPAHLQNNDWWITQENEKMESADVCEIAEKIKNLYKF